MIYSKLSITENASYKSLVQQTLKYIISDKILSFKYSSEENKIFIHFTFTYYSFIIIFNFLLFDYLFWNL